MYRNDNPDLPSLEPWILKTKPAVPTASYSREILTIIGSTKPVSSFHISIGSSCRSPTARSFRPRPGRGESDLQARYLRFDNYTFLKASEERNSFNVRLWRTGPGSQLALYPNVQCR